ncbi:phage tail spike protein [Niallia sp. Sow4_A1]|uniref:phage tail spike protein n=1 Tax=Niallia sp. Sow4_A1 TaxID=3438793 RepID=UPI003F9901DE
MYEVKIYDDINDNLGTLIHSPFPNKVKLSAGNIKQIIKGISNGSITINPNNPGWGKIKSMKTLIKVKDIKRNKIVFKGRILKPTYIMTNNGMFSIEYAIENELAYLNDSNQRFGEYHNISVRDFFTVIIDNHNRQVEPHKQFKVGNVTVMDSNDSLYRYLGYEKTFATIKDKLIDRLGGYLVIREEFDGNYIDYLAEVGENSSTEIRLRRNLKDMQREIDPNGIITRLIPLGSRIESDDEQATDASQARIDIKEVNGGLDYLDDIELIKEFGVIEGTLELDDVTDKSVIKTRGQQFLVNQKATKITYSLTPVDVSLIDQSFDELKVGNRHKVINEVFGINEQLQIIEKNIDLLNPVKISLTIGEKYQTLTQYQVDSRKQVRNVEKLERQVTSYSNKIGTISTELTTTKQTLQQTQEQLQNFESVTDGDLAVISQSVTDLIDIVDELEQTVNNIPSAQLASFDSNGLMSSSDYNKLYFISQSSNTNDFKYYDFGVNIRYAFEVIDNTLSEGSGVGNGYYRIRDLLEEIARKIDEHEFKITRLEGGQ